MSDESTDGPRCAICGGLKSEHKDRVHAFTERKGELLTQEEAAKRDRPPGMLQPGVVRIGGAPTNEANALNRLLELLMAKGFLSLEEAFYVATGNQPPPQKFADPAAVAGGRFGT